MRGPYDQRLRAVLLEATRRKACDQTSLAEALRREQSGMSKFLRGAAGRPLDLDAAHEALMHCGFGGLREFVNETPPPQDDIVPAKLHAALRQNEPLRQLLLDLLDVPRGSRAELLRTFRFLVNERKRGR